jgi:hypothetical protein
MLKIARISSLALMVALSAGLPASASEEDAAAPAGSFTSDMAAPHGQFAMRHEHRFWFRHHAHMQARAMERTPRSVIE